MTYYVYFGPTEDRRPHATRVEAENWWRGHPEFEHVAPTSYKADS